MPRISRKKPLYQRSPYWLDYDRKRDGSLRSPHIAIFWYDASRGRVRSVSTGTTNVDEAKDALDLFYLKNQGGLKICSACGQQISDQNGILVLRAINDYLLQKQTAASYEAIKARLNHVINYIETLPSIAITCEQIDENWVENFRKWMKGQQIETHSKTTGKTTTRPRSLATIENSVLQLAAALNATRNDRQRVARFKVNLAGLSRTPQKRLTVDELAKAFAYAKDPRFPAKRAALHRFLLLSVSTLARPDAVHDFDLAPAKGQWNDTFHAIDLNPKGRRQTKKHRATVIAPRQLAPLLNQIQGAWIPGKTIRSAWRSMCKDLGWPGDGEAGMKLIRRSVATLVRHAGTPKAWNSEWQSEGLRVSESDLEVQLGHRVIKSTSDRYAPSEPDYLFTVKRAIEGIIDAIIERVPDAFVLSGAAPLAGPQDMVGSPK